MMTELVPARSASILFTAVTLFAAMIPTRAQRTELIYETRSFVQSSGTCRSGDETGACTTATFAWPEVTSAGSADAAAAINGSIQEWLRRRVFEDDGGTPAEIAAGLQRAHDELREEFPDYTLPWYVERRVTVVRHAPGVFAVSMYEDLFTGGAHGAHTLRYRNHRPDTGAVIELADILISEGTDEITAVAERIFREQMAIAPDASLGQEGFWFENDRFALNDNFLIDDEGLRFFYNEYEIRAYAYGPTELLVPYEAIAALLRPDAAIR